MVQAENYRSLKSGTLAARTGTFPASLEQGTRYAIQLVLRDSSTPQKSRMFATRRFRTAADLDRAIGDYGADSYANSSQAGGCFAFGGTEAQIQACLCGPGTRGARGRTRTEPTAAAASFRTPPGEPIWGA